MTSSAVLSDSGYPLLKDYVLRHTGLNYYLDKDSDFASQLANRVSALHISSCHAYLSYLRESAEEMANLVGQLTIGETYFFRQHEHFDLMRRTILPDLIERNGVKRRLRIWSAGCANGAEPYSIAILLKRFFESELEGWDLSILGTDINKQYLEQARAGLFSKWALRDVPEEVRRCCFEPSGRGWQLKSAYRTLVRFEQQNLADDEAVYPGYGDPFDLVVCRNVLIYFSRERIQNVANRLYESLTPGGWLLVGHAEPNAELFSRFSLTISSEASAYRRPFTEGESKAIHEYRPTVAQLPSGKRDVPKSVPPIMEAPVEQLPIPAEPSAQLQEIQRLSDAGRWAEAEALCRQRITAEPLDAIAHLTLGLILEHSSCGPETQAAFRRAIYLDRSFVFAHYQLGICLLSAGSWAQATKAFQNVLELIDLSPENELIPAGDGMTVSEMRELAGMQLARIEARPTRIAE